MDCGQEAVESRQDCRGFAEVALRELISGTLSRHRLPHAETARVLFVVLRHASGATLDQG